MRKLLAAALVTCALLAVNNGMAARTISQGQMGPETPLVPAEEALYVAQGCPASFTAVSSTYLRVDRFHGMPIQVSVEAWYPSAPAVPGTPMLRVVQRAACEIPMDGGTANEATPGHPVVFLATGLYVRLTVSCVCFGQYSVQTY